MGDVLSLVIFAPFSLPQLPQNERMNQMNGTDHNLCPRAVTIMQRLKIRTFALSLIASLLAIWVISRLLFKSILNINSRRVLGFILNICCFVKYNSLSWFISSITLELIADTASSCMELMSSLGIPGIWKELIKYFNF